MRIKTTFRHLDHTPALDERIQMKSEKLLKYFEGNINLHWTCYVKEDGSHCSELHAFGSGIDFHASAQSENLYKTFDKVINKIERQVHKRKDKLRNRVHTNIFNPKQLLMDDAESREEWVQDQIEEDAA